MSNHDALIQKFLERTISEKERKELEAWVGQNDANLAEFKNRIKEYGPDIYQEFDSDAAFQEFSKTVSSKKQEGFSIHPILKYAAAAAIIFTLGYLVKQNWSVDSEKTIMDSVVIDDRQPENEGIVIKLANGSAKTLKSEDDFIVTDDDGNVIAHQGGNTLEFGKDEKLQDKVVVYNEVSIPYGQTFKLKLSDGTMVWLNAGSKLRFPRQFVDSENNRLVYLEGEAFFDVTSNKEMPFIVNVHDVDVRVVGTQFNISSYSEDEDIITTLVEGKVNVYEKDHPTNIVDLTPNLQARYNKSDDNFKKLEVDTSIYTAWIQNKLVIDNLSFSEILKRLERRHHVRFVNHYQEINKETFKGEFKDESLETILKTISVSTPFAYEIENNKITITKE